MSRRVSMDELIAPRFWKPGGAATRGGRVGVLDGAVRRGEVEGYRTEFTGVYWRRARVRFFRGGGDAGAVESMAVTRRRLRWRIYGWRRRRTGKRARAFARCGGGVMGFHEGTESTESDWE